MLEAVVTIKMLITIMLLLSKEGKEEMEEGGNVVI